VLSVTVSVRLPHVGHDPHRQLDWRAYTFCVLEQFHRHLKRRDIFAANSSKWGDPRAKLLAGDAWTTAKPMVLASLGLPEDPTEHLAERARLLHDSYRDVASRLPQNARGPRHTYLWRGPRVQCGSGCAARSDRVDVHGAGAGGAGGDGHLLPVDGDLHGLAGVVLAEVAVEVGLGLV
jgi:hypothetical protein